MPIIALLHGMIAAQLSQMANVPLMLKRRDMIELNDTALYLEQLERRVRGA